MTVLIAVITYKRPGLLTECLDSVQRWANGAELLIVDNDPDGAAAVIASEYRATYLVEGVPGIAAARNAALDYASHHDFTAVAFIDDDEQITEGWLIGLEDASVRFGADAVFGPVLPVYPETTPRWVRQFGFFDRPRQPTGGAPKWPATNNVLISLEWLHGPGEDMRFNESFSITGGSDTEFFGRMRELGASLVWSDEAVVTEFVQPNRASVRWLWRRGVRLGNVSARMLSKRHSTWAIWGIAVCRIAVVPFLVLKDIAVRRRIGPTLMNVPKGIGMMRAMRRRLTMEYAR